MISSPLYNHQRLQKKFNNLSPFQYRTQVA
ncbi:IS3 family transposase [Bacillus cereus group sp. RP43]